MLETVFMLVMIFAFLPQALANAQNETPGAVVLLILAAIVYYIIIPVFFS